MYSGVTGREFACDIYRASHALEVLAAARALVLSLWRPSAADDRPVGVVYYQRLRHMVNDKWQVRTTGKVDAVTRQPVKGRKRGGGIRFGEMERDALLAHGTSFLLQDRLMNCSDYSTGWVCRTCGSLISLGYDSVASAARVGRDNVDPLASLGPSGEYCRICRADDDEALKLEGVGIEAETGPPSVRFSLADNAERIGRRGQMDVIAIPHVFKVRAGHDGTTLTRTQYLAAELAAMSIRLSVTVA